MSQQLLDFTGKVVLITGGRSGIGQATAVAFARQGAKVVIAGRSNADETLARIKDAGGEAIFVQGDVSIAADVQRFVNTTVEKYGRLDVAFNNSGLLPVTADLVDQTEEDYDKIMNVDLKGLFLCLKYEIAEMLKQGGGAIINCGSVASLIADPGMSPYVAAKHGVAGFTKAAGIEYAKKNIRVNAIAPGLTGTEMTSGWLSDPAMCELVKTFNAANRIASPEEMAGVVLFLASPLASFITGAIYPVDAGQTAH
ncbi:A-factor type gamma-butyrolactone 1'-reductase (1S-forming) [Sporomusa silvacetica DSM 10669]|uniref:A-factor type gamma-butyrolactone 1'-reductase (1S-forming) n=1 Tax=Sporomusa silvacetica DSM 10669 TaxID=1123289 RepID=A0ABZ3IJ05_9FIRM|nr:glucose 1-dehydrogenase [Sporomusa silvacetica]OZC18459.1 glucose 1-dehydrogenase [Sporomusa silvacetica DSM 10669]